MTQASTHRREGGFLVVALGVSGCGAICPQIRAGASGRMEGGYRWGLVSLGVATSLGGANYALSDSDDEDIYVTTESRGSLRMFGIGPFLQLNPAPTGRFDPFFAIGLEYHRLTDAFKVDVGSQTVEVKSWAHAPALRLGTGLPIFVAERTALGLRYDRSIPLSGAECIEIDGKPPEGEHRCRAWSRNLDDLNNVDERFVRRLRERPWSVALELRVGF